MYFQLNLRFQKMEFCDRRFSLMQVCLAFGTLILFAGLIVLLVGYVTPTRIEAFGEHDLLFIDRY